MFSTLRCPWNTDSGLAIDCVVPRDGNFHPEWRQVSGLRNDGRQAAEEWLDSHIRALGKHDTADLAGEFL